MSTRNPSPSTLSRNLLGTVDDSEQVRSEYNPALLNTWPDNMIPELQYLAPREFNCNCNDTVAENDNDNVSTTPIAHPEVIICELNVKEYKPEDLQAMKAGDYLVITGNHDEKLDEHGLVSRKFTRRIAIPKDIIADEIKIHLSSDGKLTVTGKKRSEIWKIPERQTNQPAFEPHVNRLPCQQQSNHLPLQPNLIFPPFQQRINHLPFQPNFIYLSFQQHNNHSPYQRNYIYFPFQQLLNRLPFQPHNNHLPFKPTLFIYLSNHI